MRHAIIILFLVFAMLTISNLGFAATGDIVVRTLLDSVTATATSSSIELKGAKKTFQLIGATSTGTGTAAAEIQVSNDDSNWITLDTLSITTSATAAETETDYYSLDAPWKYTRGVLNVITGTGATISLVSGELTRF